jgi:hypothetical protein
VRQPLASRASCAIVLAQVARSTRDECRPPIRRLEEVGFTHQQATSVVEVIQGEVIENVATRDYVGEQTALIRMELAGSIMAVVMSSQPPT